MPYGLPDPINHLCFLTGVCISQNYFTYHSVQIFKSCSKDFKLQNLILLTRLRGTGFISQHGWVVNFYLTKMVRLKYCVPGLHQLRKGNMKGLALKYFYIMHRGGRVCHGVCRTECAVYGTLAVGWFVKLHTCEFKNKSDVGLHNSRDMTQWDGADEWGGGFNVTAHSIYIYTIITTMATDDGEGGVLLTPYTCMTTHCI